MIAPTTHCNARCFYCYQYGAKRENMTDETADKPADFIASHHGSKEVRIPWRGEYVLHRVLKVNPDGFLPEGMGRIGRHRG